MINSDKMERFLAEFSPMILLLNSADSGVKLSEFSKEIQSHFGHLAWILCELGYRIQPPQIQNYNLDLDLLG